MSHGVYIDRTGPFGTGLNKSRPLISNEVYKPYKLEFN